MSSIYAIRRSDGKYLKRGFGGHKWNWTSEISDARLYSRETAARSQRTMILDHSGPELPRPVVVVRIPLGPTVVVWPAPPPPPQEPKKRKSPEYEPVHTRCDKGIGRIEKSARAIQRHVDRGDYPTLCPNCHEYLDGDVRARKL